MDSAVCWKTGWKGGAGVNARISDLGGQWCRSLDEEPWEQKQRDDRFMSGVSPGLSQQGDGCIDSEGLEPMIKTQNQ